MRKNTIAAMRIREQLKICHMSSRELARVSGVGYYTMDNILAGKSSNIDKLKKIAQTLNQELEYFIDPNYSASPESAPLRYDVKLHCDIIRIAYEICNKKNIFLTKERMDNLVDLIYPRLQKTGDRGKLAKMQTEAIIDYALKIERQ